MGFFSDPQNKGSKISGENFGAFFVTKFVARKKSFVQNSLCRHATLTSFTHVGAIFQIFGYFVGEAETYTFPFFNLSGLRHEMGFVPGKQDWKKAYLTAPQHCNRNVVPIKPRPQSSAKASQCKRSRIEIQHDRVYPSGASGGSLHGGASFKVGKAHFAA